MGISDLTGPHRLMGIDRFNDDRKTYEWSDETENVEVIRIDLDGRVIEFWEDPSDGYRSLHNGPVQVDAVLDNSFAPIDVVCEHVTSGRCKWNASEEANILRIRNAMTGDVILDVGTDNVADYYPSWVCEFSAEAIGVR